jgi:hypothetical protein
MKRVEEFALFLLSASAVVLRERAISKCEVLSRLCVRAAERSEELEGWKEWSKEVVDAKNEGRLSLVMSR